jgi:ribonuclease R
MKQARYSPEDAGHFALAEHDYCHFTSPIRRYPDLTIHRLVGELAERRTPVAEDPVTLAELGKRCSETERRAEKAERELIRIRLLRYMADRIGQEMDAIITGVENFGLFCQGIEIPAEGMIHSSALGDDFYQFDTATRTLTGQRTKREFRLGDPIRVVVARVDVDRRQLDLRVAESSKSTHAPGRVPRTSSSGRKKSDRENVSRSVSGSTNSGSTDAGSSKSRSTKSGLTKRSGKPHQPREQANPSSRSEPRDDQNHRGQKKSGQRKQAGKRAESRGKKGKR